LGKKEKGMNKLYKREYVDNKKALQKTEGL
jgi:hypothetical protein